MPFEFEFQVFCEGENWNSSVPTCLVKPGDPLLELPELVTLVLTNDCGYCEYDLLLGLHCLGGDGDDDA